MHALQATWLPDHRLFFWSVEGTVEEVMKDELPAIAGDAIPETRTIAEFADRPRRRKTRGLGTAIESALPTLTALPADADVSPSVAAWAIAAKLAVDLAARQRVVPTVTDGRARWRALLSRAEDHARFEALADAMPGVTRAVPTEPRGAIRLPSRRAALRTFLDEIVDTLYRSGAHPGPGRGWALEYAQALRNGDPAFSPRDARYQGVPDALATWSAGAESAGLRVGFRLALPTKPNQPFKCTLLAHPSEDSSVTVPVGKAWKAGEHIRVGGRIYGHAAHTVMRDLARASRVFEPLREAIAGRAIPSDLRWDAQTTWEFLDKGAEALRDAGFSITIPDALDRAGKRRIRARMCVDTPENDRFDLTQVLSFRWEVTLGDRVVTGAEFAELIAVGKPLVLFRGEWVVLDPAELARLPDGLPQAGNLPTSEALRAVLVGHHNGVPVVAGDRLELLLRALRNPPEEPIPAGLQATLRPYQARGLSWLATMGRLGLGCCLADDMGLGKTVQLIAHLVARKRPGAHTLVVCPTSVLGNWERELARFAPGLTVQRYHGNDRVPSNLTRCDVTLTTYGVLVRDAALLRDVQWDVLALDEAQAIKNPSSRRARAARALNAHHRVALSGTPVENRLDELWSLMEFMMPGLLGPRQRFRREIAVPIERFGDQDLAEQLKLGVSPFLLRRLKTDPTIIDDLPEKIERRDWSSLTREQADLYQAVVDDHMARIAEAGDIERRGLVLAMLTRLKQVCNHPAQYLDEEGPMQGRSGKLERCVELVDALLESDERALIFTQYRAMGSRLAAHLQEQFGVPVAFYHGGTPARARDEIVRSFQEDDDGPPLLVVSLRAGGTGLNLTAASHVIHYDRWWNPAVEDQATDRAYRIGQRRNVQVHKMITQGTLEERIDQIVENKRALAESVVGSGEGWVTELDDDALRRLVSLGQDAVVDPDDEEKE
jgi:superfamily II DNA or RNA helicase